MTKINSGGVSSNFLPTIVEAPKTPKPAVAAPADAMSSVGVRMQGLAAFAPGVKSAAVGLTKEVAKTTDPTAILQSLDSAEIEIRVPGTIGKFGHFPANYEVEPNTIVTISAVVENGKLVPERTKVVFQPKLNTLFWVDTEGLSFKRKGEDRAKIELDLGGFPDINITRFLLDMKTIPLAVGELLDIAKGKAAQLKALAEFEEAPKSFNPQGFEIDLKKATFKQGAIPLGPNATLVLAPGNEVTASGSKDDLRIAGKLRVSEYSLEDGHSTIAGGPIEADANIKLALDDTLKTPTQVSVSLQNVTGQLDLAHLDDGKGNKLLVGATQVSAGHIGFDQTGQSLSVVLPDVNTHIAQATFSVMQGGVSVPVEIAPGTFSGAFGMMDGVISATAKSAQLVASAKNITLGEGDLKIGYAALGIGGRGQLDFDGENLALSGLLAFKGVVSDGNIGRKDGPMLVNLRAGSEIDLKVDSATFGPKERSFRGSGDFTAKVESGAVVLPSGATITLGAGSTAHVATTELVVDNQGFSAKGRIELQGAVESNGKTTAKIALDDVSIEQDGRFLIGNAEASVQAQVTEVTGKLRAKPRLVETKVIAGPKNRPGVNVEPPSLRQMFNAVADAQVAFSLPVPEGSVGVWPANTRVKPGTVAKFEMNVKDGVIDRQSVRLTFSPPIDGPLWVSGNGIKVDKAGNFIVDLKGFPNINLSRLLFGTVKMPQTLDQLGSLAETVQSFGRIIRPQSGESDPLQTLQKLGATFDAQKVRLSGKRLSLGEHASVVPGNTSTYSLKVKDGVASLSGVGELLDGDIDDDDVTIENMRGTAELNVTVRSGNEVEAHLTGLKAKVSKLNLVRNGNQLKFSESSIGDGRITLTKSGAAKAQVTATFADVDAHMTASKFRAKGEIDIDVPDAAFTGTLTLSPQQVAGEGYVRDMTLTLPPIDMPLAVTGGTVKASGDFKFNSADKTFDVAGGVAELQVAAASFGDTLRFGEGSTMSLDIAQLSIGQAISGRGVARLSLQEGEVSLPGAKLKIGPSTTGTLQIDKLQHDKGAAFGTLEGKLSFAANLSGELKNFTAAPGVTIERVGANTEQVQVTIEKVALAPDGSYSLGDISLALQARAQNIAGAIGGKAPVVFLKQA